MMKKWNRLLALGLSLTLLAACTPKKADPYPHRHAGDG